MPYIVLSVIRIEFLCQNNLRTSRMLKNEMFGNFDEVAKLYKASDLIIKEANFVRSFQ